MEEKTAETQTEKRNSGRFWNRAGGGGHDLEDGGVVHVLTVPGVIEVVQQAQVGIRAVNKLRKQFAASALGEEWDQRV